MALSTEPLTTRLSPYPTLRKVLGPDWIAEQDAMDPVLSPFSLARWLRMDEFGTDLSMIDGILREFRDVPGMKERRRRMRSDPFALMETLTELYFALWLRHRAIPFDLPKTGADFKVNLGGGRSLAIEVTTLRLIQWAQDLFERLDLVGQRLGYSAEVEHKLETLPETSRSVQIVSTIVTNALEALTAPKVESSGGITNVIVQTYPEYETKVTWTPSPFPGLSQKTSPDTPSPSTMFYRLVSTAQKKACQLPDDQAGILLFGTVNLPQTQLWSFEKALLRDHVEFDWTQVPDQIKHVILYSFDLKRAEPANATWIVNPASTLPDVPEAIEILESLFPLLLGSREHSNPADE